jgi:hypothetical protein
VTHVFAENGERPRHLHQKILECSRDIAGYALLQRALRYFPDRLPCEGDGSGLEDRATSNVTSCASDIGTPFREHFA